LNLIFVRIAKQKQCRWLPILAGPRFTSFYIRHCENLFQPAAGSRRSTAKYFRIHRHTGELTGAAKWIDVSVSFMLHKLEVFAHSLRQFSDFQPVQRFVATIVQDQLIS
jgi:hypothetical protein